MDESNCSASSADSVKSVTPSTEKAISCGVEPMMTVVVLMGYCDLGLEFCRYAINRNIKVICLLKKGSKLFYKLTFPESLFEIVPVSYIHLMKDLRAHNLKNIDAAISFMADYKTHFQDEYLVYETGILINTSFALYCQEIGIKTYIYNSSKHLQSDIDAASVTRRYVELALDNLGFEHLLILRPGTIQLPNKEISSVGVPVLYRNLMRLVAPKNEFVKATSIVKTIVYYLFKTVKPPKQILDPFDINRIENICS